MGKVDDTQKVKAGNSLDNRFRKILEKMSGEERYYYWLHLKNKHDIVIETKKLTSP